MEEVMFVSDFAEADLQRALETSWHSMDLERVTVRDFLQVLLETLMQKGEQFSGKRPFGNSGWQSDLATPLIASGLIRGELDDDGYVESYDRAELERALVALAGFALRRLA